MIKSSFEFNAEENADSRVLIITSLAPSPVGKGGKRTRTGVEYETYEEK